MRLYYHPMSSNARRAVMTALHLKSPVQLVLVDLGKGDQRKPEYLAINPNGRVPTLDDDGFYLSESHAIMQYLCDKTPGQTLYPQDIRARADVNRWLFWNAHHFAPAVAVLNWERVVKPFTGGGEPDPREVERGTRLVTQFATRLDQHLKGKECVAQDKLTLADFALATPLMTLKPAGLPVADCRNLLAWFERITALDAWQQSAR